MASISIPCPKGSPSPPVSSRNHQPVPTRILSVASLQGPKLRRFPVLKAQACEASLENSSNSSPVASSRSKTELSNGAVAEESTSQSVVPESVITAFMAEVSDLVKLVDSRDITELQLKQKDCELIIRKKQALQPAPSAPVVMMAPPQAMYSPPPPPPPPLPSAVPPPTSAAPSPVASAAALPAPAKGSKSSHPPLKCPMAGTFYRSPAPGEPAFVKVGDKVKKGQVVCIIEAMKLMNEIEADQSGTVVDILAVDGKPVSVDTPLLVIEP